MSGMSTADPAPLGTPRLAEGSWVAPTATVLGDVRIGAGASVWYGTVVRADLTSIEVGEGTNLQDGTVVHADPGFPARIGARVAVGHRAVLHGCTIEDDVLVGMGAIVLNGAVVGSGSVVGAAALVTQGTQIPPNSLVVGAPAKVVRQTTEQERAGIARNAEQYQELARRHAAHWAAQLPIPPART